MATLISATEHDQIDDAITSSLELRRLGEAVRARSSEILAETVIQTSESGQRVDEHVQKSFERICTSSTVAVARWIAGDGLEVTLDASRETSTIFGELAAHRAASLHEVTRRSMLRDADIAMYRAKRDGRNRYAVFESGMQKTVQDRMELEMDLREALANNEFVLAYQPTLDLNEMRPTGVEALIRWQHPTRGLVQPDAFVPILEETGLITPIGRWVLKEACNQAAEWHISGHPITMAVNVSGRQLDSDQLVDDIQDALAESGLQAAALTIEITETTLMRDIEETVERLTKIKDLGVRIAIDDFGTGYSSLAHLQRFPVDALKIDRSFIAGLEHNKEGETLLRTLVQLGKALSIETFAEGIEQDHELSLLQAEDCDSGQGFLFARPLDPAAAEQFLKSWPQREAHEPGGR